MEYVQVYEIETDVKTNDLFLVFVFIFILKITYQDVTHEVLNCLAGIGPQ